MEIEVPWAKPSRKAKSFWNSACSRVTSEAKRRLREAEKNPCEETNEARRRAGREKVSVLNRAKALDFRNSIDRLSTNPKGL